MRLGRSYGALLALLVALALLALPVSAYSAEATAWYAQGTDALLAKNYTAAIGAYTQAITLEPGYFEAWDAKADALNRAGQYTDALAASTRALEIKPDYTQGWINRGQILYNIGYYYEDQLGDLTMADDYYKQQLLTFEKALEIDPSNADAWFNRGYALAGLKRYDEAISAFEKVRALNPDYPKLNLSLHQAEVLRDKTTPVYVKFAIPLILVIIVIAGGALYLRYRAGKGSAADIPAKETRQARRRKEP